MHAHLSFEISLYFRLCHFSFKNGFIQYDLFFIGHLVCLTGLSAIIIVAMATIDMLVTVFILKLGKSDIHTHFILIELKLWFGNGIIFPWSHETKSPKLTFTKSMLM